MNVTLWIKRIGIILVIICLGTIIDYFVHSTSPFFSVPATYFPHKILYGTLWGFVGYLIFGYWLKWVKTTLWVSVAIAAVPAVLLQTMYFIQGHQLTWVVAFFLFGHFLMFLLPGYFICRQCADIMLPSGQKS